MMTDNKKGLSGDFKIITTDGTEEFSFEDMNNFTVDGNYDYPDPAWDKLRGSSGTLSGFFDPITGVDIEILFWDGEYLVSKVETNSRKEPYFQANKWNDEELEEIELEELPKEALKEISKEMI